MNSSPAPPPQEPISAGMCFAIPPSEANLADGESVKPHLTEFEKIEHGILMLQAAGCFWFAQKRHVK